jgi:predicted Ser/Thr protein kinase
MGTSDSDVFGAALSGAWVTGVHAHQAPRALSDRFDEGGVIGEGGTARVLRGWDRVLDRAVAIKRPRDPSSGDRIVQEARVLALLAGPGVPAVFDCGRDDDGPWMVMDLVDGVSLRSRLGTMAPGALRHTLLAVGRVLLRAHSHGVVHRDLKPDNIVLTDEGGVVVLDWGLAAQVGAQPDGGLAVGTAGYMGPQQWAAEAPALSDDVWALGAMLYEGLTGSPPFGRVSASELRHRVGAEPVPLDAVPAAFQAVVGAACARSRSDRLPDAGAWVVALQASVRTTVEAPRGGTRLHALLVAVLLLGLGGAASLLVAGWVELHCTVQRGESPVARGVLAQFDTDTRPRRVRRAELRDCSGDAARSGDLVVCRVRSGTPDARLVAHGPDGSARWTLPMPGVELDVFAGAGWVFTLSRTELVAIDPGTGRVMKRWPSRTDAGMVRDGRLVGSAHELVLYGSTAWRVDLVTLDQEALDLCDGAVHDLLGTSTGSIVLCRDGRLHDRPASNNPGPVLLSDDLRVLELELLAERSDGRLVMVHNGRELLEVDREFGEGRLLATLGGRVHRLATSGDRVLVSTRQGPVELRDLRTGTLLATFPHVGASGLRLDSRFAEMVQDGVLYRYALPDRWIFGSQRAPVGVFPVRWLPDGTALVAAGVDGRLYVWSLDGSTARQVAVSAAGQPLKWVEFSPDGQTVGVSIIGEELSRTVDAATWTVGGEWLAADYGARRVVWLQDMVVAAYFDHRLRAQTDGGDPVPELSMSLDVRALTADGARRTALVAGAAGEVFLLDATDRSLRQLAVEPELAAVALAPSGTRWAVATARGVRVASVSAATDGVEFALDERPGAMALDADHVYLGFDSGRMDAYRLDGTLVARMEGHGDRVASLEVSPDGQRLVSGAWDGEVRVWQLSALRESAADVAAAVASDWGTPPG